MRNANLVSVIGVLILGGSVVMAQPARDDSARQPLENLYEDLAPDAPETLDDLLPPEAAPPGTPRADAPTGLQDTADPSELLGPPALPAGTTNARSGLEPIPATPPRRQSMANQPYTLAGILDDENAYIDCLCEKEFCERMRQCASSSNRGWGLLRNWDLFWGRTPRNRDNSMQCWQCSARLQQQQQQQMQMQMQMQMQNGVPQTAPMPYPQGNPGFVPSGVPGPGFSVPTGQFGPTYPTGAWGYPDMPTSMPWGTMSYGP